MPCKNKAKYWLHTKKSDYLTCNADGNIIQMCTTLQMIISYNKIT